MTNVQFRKAELIKKKGSALNELKGRFEEWVEYNTTEFPVKSFGSILDPDFMKVVSEIKESLDKIIDPYLEQLSAEFEAI